MAAKFRIGDLTAGSTVGSRFRVGGLVADSTPVGGPPAGPRFRVGALTATSPVVSKLRVGDLVADSGDTATTLTPTLFTPGVRLSDGSLGYCQVYRYVAGVLTEHVVKVYR